MSTLTAKDVTTLKSLNPATGDLVGEVTVTTMEQLARKVRAARAAQPGWAALEPAARADAIRPAGRLLVERSEELARLLCNEMGKPLQEAKAEIRSCGEPLDARLREIDEALQPDVLEDDRHISHVYHDPFGVCASITPWNFPLAMPHWMVVPALMAGNTVLLKPSEETPLIAQAYVDLLNQSLPEGVLQIVHGADEQGRALVRENVDLIAFTGSRTTGQQILTAAGSDLKRVILELGGKDPLIVLDDADVDKAACFAVQNSFRNAGQVCVSTERIYVDERVAEQFESAVVRLTGEMKVGEGTGEKVDVGPMINGQQRDHVLAQVRDAVERGARVIAGGKGHHDNFIMPTVLVDVDHDMPIMREETFGPVACIMRFHDDEQAITLANDTPYGLGAVVFGSDKERTATVARRLGAGMVGINKNCGGASGTPWVGARQSGYGYHGGREGHRQFAQPRVVTREKAS
jgi:acyl-CoA reductase-like NAD-dependent aldehyde dehydrogenase